MIGVAKVVIIDDTNKYLLLERSDHPTLFNDADLPGGVIEPGESPTKALVREVQEEIGIEMPPSAMHQVYEGADYSERGTVYHLFTATLPERPAIAMSWEHAGYEWLEREAFLSRAHAAADTYMHMVYNVLQKVDAQ